MLHPSQYKVNEAWIVFKLNETPICTEIDGDFNVVRLMDAASCYILGNDFVPVECADVPAETVRQLLDIGNERAGAVPSELIVTAPLRIEQLDRLGASLAITTTVRANEELSAFLTEAREGFRQHVGGGRAQ